MFTSSYLNPYSSSFLTPPSNIFHSFNQLHRRRNSPIPIPINSADVIEREAATEYNRTPSYTGHYRIPITDSSTKETKTQKPADVSVAHEKPIITRKANLRLRSPTNPFEEAEQTKSDFGLIDREWEREMSKRKAIELERLEAEELSRALKESLQSEKERQRLEQEKREQEDLAMALKISEEEAKQREIHNEIQRSLRLKKEESIRKGKGKALDEDEEVLCECTEDESADSHTKLSCFNHLTKSKIRLSPEPALDYPNTTLVTINMWGKQYFNRRFYVDEPVASIRNWVETFNTPQNYTMKIKLPRFLTGAEISEMDMTKTIQDVSLYPKAEILIQPC
eukprot:TRINITY_DN865_c0_g1_i7.p1 TRINITY_DN865_c0_g1~~TRINITY_DN865_c0_g1_i7.p1  ORF type:complete len:338 (-),score=76.21 TRINITY_DN865_c0_g1_i7:301-1314(-)